MRMSMLTMFSCIPLLHFLHHHKNSLYCCQLPLRAEPIEHEMQLLLDERKSTGALNGCTAT